MQNGGFYGAYEPQTCTLHLFPSCMNSFASACTRLHVYVCVCVFICTCIYEEGRGKQLYLFCNNCFCFVNNCICNKGIFDNTLLFERYCLSLNLRLPDSVKLTDQFASGIFLAPPS